MLISNRDHWPGCKKKLCVHCQHFFKSRCYFSKGPNFIIVSREGKILFYVGGTALIIWITNSPSSLLFWGGPNLNGQFCSVHPLFTFYGRNGFKNAGFCCPFLKSSRHNPVREINSVQYKTAAVMLELKAIFINSNAVATYFYSIWPRHHH